jgi:hypothetical protein
MGGRRPNRRRRRGVPRGGAGGDGRGANGAEPAQGATALPGKVDEANAREGFSRRAAGERSAAARTTKWGLASPPAPTVPERIAPSRAGFRPRPCGPGRSRRVADKARRLRGFPIGFRSAPEGASRFPIPVSSEALRLRKRPGVGSPMEQAPSVSPGSSRSRSFDGPLRVPPRQASTVPFRLSFARRLRIRRTLPESGVGIGLRLCLALLPGRPTSRFRGFRPCGHPPLPRWRRLAAFLRFRRAALGREPSF